MSTIKQIQKVNEVYHIMNKQYETLKKMFRNHKMIVQKIILSEGILNQAFMAIANKTEEVEGKREFNKIIKKLKEK